MSARWRIPDQAELSALHNLVDAQALDDGLWFVARTAPEAYLQNALRALHAAIESCSPRSGREGK